jgi:V/A-type H+/Na+-transporting ATPase subunit I
MAIEKMELVKVSGSLESMTEACEKLCESECFHPEQAAKHISAEMGLIPFTDENPYAAQLSELNELVSSAGITPELVELEKMTQLSEEDKEYIRSVKKKIADYNEKINSLNEQKTVCEAGIKSYEHFKGLDVDLDDIAECEFIKVRFGHLPKESYKRLNTVYKDNPYVFFYPCSEDKTDYWGAYFAPVDKLDEIDGIFAFLFFEPTPVPGAAGTVDEVIEQFTKSIEIITSTLDETQKELTDFLSSETEHLNYLYSNMMYLNSVYELRGYALHNEKFFAFVGYVPKSETEKLNAALKDVKSVLVEYEDAPKDESVVVPVKYKKRNKLFSLLIEPYKFYVDMYGSPSYTDIDVTAFVAITYTVLFGIMFGDLGQGFVLAVLGFCLWKFKKSGLGKILVPCGISSMIFGFVFGSVFGFEEALNPVYEKLGWSGKPLSVMDSINTVLLFAIAIGVGLMVVAIVMNIYACIKRKHIGEAIFSQNGLVGLILYLCGVNLASGFMGGPSPIPSAVCAPMLGACAFLLFIKEIPIGIIDKHPDWKPESVSDFILQNLFELLEYILSYLSNTVSFLRVGAFVLVHAGMMMVVFSLAGDSENIFVIVLGNVLVIALEGLLTGIQALRLEYYEMFSRFFDGSGIAYTPFKLNKSVNK